MMEFLFGCISIFALAVLIPKIIENSRKSKLKSHNGTSQIFGEAGKSLSSEKMRIRQSNRDKGLVGELGVAEYLADLAIEYGLTVLHDLSIPESKANIDHILITPKVIYVIDAKNYKGIVKISRGKDGTTRLRVGGRDQSMLAEKLKKYSEKVEEFLNSEDISVKIVPLLAFYRATFHEDSATSINGVTVNIFGIENELLRYANLKSPAINMEDVAKRLLSNFPPKLSA
jgi:hypothetical protein